MRALIFAATSIALIVGSLSLTANAQRYGYDNNNLRSSVRDLDRNALSYKRALDRALDNSALNGTRLEDEINGYVKDFRRSTDQLKDNVNNDREARQSVREVFDHARRIDRWMAGGHLRARGASDEWRRVRRSMERVARDIKDEIRW